MVESPGRLFRVGRPPNPFRWRKPPDSLPDADHPVLDGRRWDDPQGEFVTVYASTTELAAIAETIAPFRRAPGLRERILAATDDDQTGEIEEPDWESELGVVPAGFFERALGMTEISADAQFIDVDHPATHRLLNAQVGDLLQQLGVAVHFDRGVMMTQDRRVTRPIARFLYEHYAGTADGIRFESRLAAGLECFALWSTAEPKLGACDPLPLSPEDPRVEEAARLVGVGLPALSDMLPQEWVDRT